MTLYCSDWHCPKESFIEIRGDVSGFMGGKSTWLCWDHYAFSSLPKGWFRA